MMSEVAQKLRESDDVARQEPTLKVTEHVHRVKLLATEDGLSRQTRGACTISHIPHHLLANVPFAFRPMRSRVQVILCRAIFVCHDGHLTHRNFRWRPSEPVSFKQSDSIIPTYKKESPGVLVGEIFIE